jgi:hypothetical protein
MPDALDAYLAAEAGSQRPQQRKRDALDIYLEQEQANLQERPAENAGQESQPETTLAGRIGSRIVESAKGIGRAAKAVATHPKELLLNERWGGDPAYQREFVRGISDATTLGYATKAGEKLLQMTGSGRSFEQNAQEDAAAAPDIRTAGQITGSFLPGASNLLGKAGGKLAGKIIPTPGALGGAGRALLGYGAAAPVAAGLHAESEGHRLEAAREAATDPGGLALAGLLGAVGGGVKSKIARSRGYQARQLIEQRGQGARVGLTTPGEGGVFDRELASVPANDRGIGIAAKRGARGILKGLKEEHRIETSHPYQVMKSMLDNSPEAGKLRDITPIVSNMQNAVYDLETAPNVRTQLEGQLKILERYRANQEAPVMLPERQLNGLRRTLMRAAKIGQTDAPGEKEAPLRAAAFQAKQMVDQGPYAALNEFYAEGAKKLGTSRRQLGLKPRAPADSAVDERKLKLTLMRQGQNTQTAGVTRIWKPSERPTLSWPSTRTFRSSPALARTWPSVSRVRSMEDFWSAWAMRGEAPSPAPWVGPPGRTPWRPWQAEPPTSSSRMRRPSPAVSWRH